MMKIQKLMINGAFLQHDVAKLLLLSKCACQGIKTSVALLRTCVEEPDIFCYNKLTCIPNYP